jgi:hypothetical protein
MRNGPRLPSLTTLQLARAIADAVLRTDPHRHRDSEADAPTQAVLHTLHRTGTCFMTDDKDAAGAGIAETTRRVP